jgi:hypothetical protein
MEQSSSWEAYKFSASHEIPRILWNPKVHYRSHKCFTVSQHECFYGVELLAPLPNPPPPTWRTTPCRLFSTAYSIYSQLPSILEAFPSSATWGRAIPWWQEPTYHGAVHYSLFKTSLPGDRHLYHQSDDAPRRGYKDPITRENVCKLIILINTEILHKTSFWGNYWRENPATGTQTIRIFSVKANASREKVYTVSTICWVMRSQVEVATSSCLKKWHPNKVV